MDGTAIATVIAAIIASIIGPIVVNYATKNKVQNQNTDTLTIDSTPLLGAEKGRVVLLPYSSSKTVDTLLDEIYFSQRPNISAYSYRTEWILRDIKSGKIYREIGTKWANDRGLERDNRSLKEVEIISGMKLEIIRA